MLKFIVRRLNQIAPLEGLRHVKRIRKKVLEGQIELSVVLCLACEGDNQLDGVPPHLQEFISSYQLSPFITKVGFLLFFYFSHLLMNYKVCLDYGFIINVF
jgi:hypothetical protein